MGDVRIVRADDEWPEEFLRVAVGLQAAAGEAAASIDHIGSTSVRGLDSKDVIDVQITDADAGQLTVVCRLLTEAGFEVAEDAHDHVVPGIPSESAADWAKAFSHERGGERRANIHIRIAGRPNQIYPRLFRDYLRAHPAAANAYGAFKWKAARLLANDSFAYADLKDPVCDMIYLSARKWAQESGWPRT